MRMRASISSEVNSLVRREKPILARRVSEGCVKIQVHPSLTRRAYDFLRTHRPCRTRILNDRNFSNGFYPPGVSRYGS